ncbi:hypothetical protein AEAC466_04745 [Asticcacaulis sp. AC466]|uniref:ArnT family glycosyltransferase n=1 Tax=Asticcacaulis sp. AC466 TaxID=1282362 RepID=UPI0003C3C178|nr:glycosyltransferase family 39 protein [Asticcacaulis sp. AC466]ESQ85017.1 hypothetical protein AEAC466_04745 [Asticcacaulis sp. AC466]
MPVSNSAYTGGVREDFSLVAHLRPVPFLRALSRGETIVWVLVLSFAIRLILANLMPLTADEAYAVVVSRSHALSYYDHPPLAFALARFMADLFGSESPGLLRLPFVLMGVGSTIFLYDITRRAYGGDAALWAGTAFSCSPFFFTFAGGLIVPDGPLDFFLLVCFWSIQPVLMGARNTWSSWILTGGALGLAVLSKYHAVLFGVDALIALALNPNWRPLLKTPKAWTAFAIAALGGIPILIWNATHGWASFAFQAGRAYEDNGFGGHAANFMTVVAGQALYLMPVTWFVAQREIWRAITRPDAGMSRLLAGVAVAPILIFDAIATVGHHSLPHWAMSGFLFALPLVGKARAVASPEAGKRIRTLIAGGLVMLVCVLIALQAQFGLLTRWAPEPFRHFDLSWHDLDWTAIEGNLGEPGAYIIASDWVSAGHIGLVAGRAHPIDILDDPHQFQFIDRCKLDAQTAGLYITHLPADYVAGQDIPGADHLAPRFQVVGQPTILTQTRMGAPAFDIAVVPIQRVDRLKTRQDCAA